ncbi:MAG TPA: flagellar hook-basal body complex protein [Solirubrobacteraceae bacterium]|nr:flagellar hook-basal body complex protein [Solirubrobacteraceae bacterium]
MLRSMFAAISGLKSHQTMLDVTANDIANVNTIGFKAGRTTFKDSLAQLQSGGAAPSATQGGANAKQVGLGVSLGSIDNLMQSGALQSTGNVLDVAIQGEGWFRVGSGAPPTVPTAFQYTRAGNFARNQTGYLVTQDGAYVMGRTASGAGGTDTYLQIPDGSTNVSIGQDGGVSYDPVGGGARVTAGYLSLAMFANEAGLERGSANRWNASASSGAEQVGTPGAGFGLTSSGAVEMSNVDLASEFTNMITAQRGFQANSRVISTADEILQDLVNLKR